MLKPKPLLFLLLLYVIQSSAFPSILTGSFKPDLVLLGILLLSLELPPQLILGEAVIVGLLLDSSAGRFVGIHAIFALCIPLLVLVFSGIFSTSKIMLLFFFSTIVTLFYQVTLYGISLATGIAVTSFSTYMLTLVFPALFWNSLSALLLYSLFNPLLVRWSHSYEA